MPPSVKPSKVQPSTFAELITSIVVTPDAPNNLISDWISKYSILPTHVGTTSKAMSNKPTKKQLLRAKKMQRRTS